MLGFAPLIALLSLGCSPQNAELGEASMVAFFPASTSRNALPSSDIEFDEADVAFNIDCTGQSLLASPRDICNQAWPPEHEGWAEQDAYKVIAEKIDAFRGEGIITSEGDFQIAFHHRLPGGEDFRFIAVVDPVFQPTECVQDGNGGVQLVDKDGDWVQNWSADLDSEDFDPDDRYAAGTLYYLNSNAFQVNPSDTEDLWFLPDEWGAGYVAGRIGPEDLVAQTTRFGTPTAYTLFETDQATGIDSDDLFYQPLSAGEDASTNTGFQSLISGVLDISADSEEEFGRLVGAELDALGLATPFRYRPMVHSNEWRPGDGVPGGLDGWVELHYNWIRLDPSSDLTEGGTASGEFFFTLNATESESRVFIQGDFTVPKIKADRWVTRDLQAEKFEENDTRLCGQDAIPAE